MRRVIPLDVRKQWARATSKQLKHTRAERDVLTHLAFRAGYGRVWNYTLKQIAADISEDGAKVVEKTVRRAVAKFKDQGIITVKNHSQKPLEYIFPVWTNCPARLDKMSAPFGHSSYDSSTKKETLKETLKKEPEDDVNFINAPQGQRGVATPLLETPETPQEPLPDEEPCWAGAFESNGVIQVKDIPRQPVVEYKPKGNCNRCEKQLQERDQRPPTCKDCRGGISPYMIKFNAANREVYQ